MYIEHLRPFFDLLWRHADPSIGGRLRLTDSWRGGRTTDVRIPDDWWIWQWAIIRNPDNDAHWDDQLTARERSRVAF